MLNGNPVIVARHFQYRVESFLKVIVLDGPLGKTNCYAIRVEFQVRGSPQVHSFISILNAPHLSSEHLYTEWLDGFFRTDLPDVDKEPQLFNLVKKYQIHRHSKTCQKFKNKSCRFHYGRYFTDHTIITQPLASNVAVDFKVSLMEKRNKILGKVKEYIDGNLNPATKNFYNPSQYFYEPALSIDEILSHLKLTRAEYEDALSISDDNSFQTHTKRPPNSCFLNSYFADGLLAWEANLDIQPVYNHYKAISYMCTY